MPSPAAVDHLRPRLIRFRDFVEQALFDPTWGYYATGAVRFGDGGHFDTYPLALSPFFGLMVARRARALWTSVGKPARFDVCEVGAGNGQLCLDVLTAAMSQSGSRDDWRRFDRALSYRILEKSPALRQRQRQQLGVLAERVEWSAADLSLPEQPPRRRRAGLVVANEVLDCLAHDKVVLGRDGVFRITYVGALSPDGKHGARPRPARSALTGRLLSSRAISDALRRGDRLEFREFLLPVVEAPEIERFLARHYPPEPSRHRAASLPWIYFACPAIETFVANAARLYSSAEILLIDYGGGRDYHLLTPGARRVAAGRPEERSATPYRAPGRDDVTFLVDFSIAMDAARRAGLAVRFYGPQGRLAALSRVRLGPGAIRRIIAHRALGWLLAVAGVGPERLQRSAAVSWKRLQGRPRTKTVAQEAREAVDEFLGRRESAFQLLLLRTSGVRRVSAALRRDQERRSRAALQRPTNPHPHGGASR